MPRNQPTVAIAYDFDGTLTPDNAQERQFIPDIGMDPDDFWAEVDEKVKEHSADQILMYMRLMLEKAEGAHVPVRLDDFRAQGKSVRFYDGVEGWFDRINGYGKEAGVRIEHYIVSSGNAEIIEGTSIAGHFAQIYACRFMFDHNGVAVWPAQAVNYTNKTQYLFRINKGAHDLTDDSKVNEFVEQQDRPIPFENMIYIGDGFTDIPCFRLVKEQGGLSIAVYRPHGRNARTSAEQLRSDGRVQAVVSANYRPKAKLDSLVKAYISEVSAREARLSLSR